MNTETVIDVPEFAGARHSAPSHFAWIWAPMVFGILTLLTFGDILFSGLAAGHYNSDLATQFIPWRTYGFSQMGRGNLPLWNPYIYGGAPYFAGFQSALLYPPNWLHMFLPFSVAVNLISALHVFLAGYFTYLWCRGRSIGIGGSILSGIIFMFSGPYFLHIYAGHLPHMAVMIWTPLILLTLDKISQTGNYQWLLLGIASVALEILAGHPQYVYFTGIAVTFYVLLLLLDSKYRLALVVGFLFIYIGGTLLSAIQLLPGVQASSEQVRVGGLSLRTASTFALPPENFLTAVAPSFFGFLPSLAERASEGAYWGRAYLWEVSLFVSLTGLVMASIAVLHVMPDIPMPFRPDTCARSLAGITNIRRRWINVLVVLLVTTVLLALGRHTPLYRPMYDFLPMYSSFRGAVKFAYLSSLFVAMLAGLGFDGVVKHRKVSFVLVFCVLFAALCMVVSGVVIMSESQKGQSGGWTAFVRVVTVTASAAGESWSSLKGNSSEAWDTLSEESLAAIARAGHHAATTLFVAAATLALIATLLMTARLHRHAPYILIALAAFEMVVFARSNRPTMDPSIARVFPEPWEAAIRQLPPEQRFFTHPNLLYRADVGMMIGKSNVSGYDPGILRRYAELLFASQARDPNTASQYIPLNRIHLPIFRLLRCGMVFHDAENSKSPLADVLSIPNVLPEVAVISDAIIIPERDAILSFMLAPGDQTLAMAPFDPVSKIVLEREPNVVIPPGVTQAATARIVRRSTDWLEITAELQQPGVLLVTNSYSSGWRVTPIRGAQSEYQVVPADYAFIGIPLEKGAHHFVLEYKPAAFVIGRMISICSLIAYLVFCIHSHWRRRRDVD